MPQLLLRFLVLFAHSNVPLPSGEGTRVHDRVFKLYNVHCVHFLVTTEKRQLDCSSSVQFHLYCAVSISIKISGKNDSVASAAQISGEIKCTASKSR